MFSRTVVTTEYPISPSIKFIMPKRVHSPEVSGCCAGGFLKWTQFLQSLGVPRGRSGEKGTCIFLDG